MEDKQIKESIFKKSTKTLTSRYITLVISLFISALLYNFLIQPSKIVIGGVNGLAQINNYINKINSSITILTISVIMLILSYFFLGKDRTKGTLIATIVYPLFVQLTALLTKNVNIDMTDLLVVSIFIGVISGFANGLLYKTGFSNGGLPIISQILYKYYDIPIGKSNFVINTIVVILGGVLFGTTKVMYAIIILYINSLIVDRVILGTAKNKAIYILTSKEDMIKEFLIKDMNHTATVFKVKGAFLDKKREMILTIIPTREYFQTTESIKLLDPEVFFLVNDAYEVKGGR